MSIAAATAAIVATPSAPLTMRSRDATRSLHRAATNVRRGTRALPPAAAATRRCLIYELNGGTGPRRASSGYAASQLKGEARHSTAGKGSRTSPRRAGRQGTYFVVSERGPARPYFGALTGARPSAYGATPRRRWSCSTGSATRRRRPRRAGASRSTRPGWEQIPSAAPAPTAAAPRDDASRARTVLVTGGSRGIGRAIAVGTSPAAAPNRFAVHYLRNEAAAVEVLVAAIRGARPARRGAPGPPGRDGALLPGWWTQQAAELGGLDLLVANAAAGVNRPALSDRGALGLDTRTRTRARSSSLARAAAPQMPAAARSSASRRSARACSGTTWSASRRPRSRRSSATSGELAPRGIRVNAVSGGVVETGALDHFPNRPEMLARGSRTRRAAWPSRMTSRLPSRCSGGRRAT